MNLQEVIFNALTQLVESGYGETPDDACYNLDYLSKGLSERIEAELDFPKEVILPGMRIRCSAMNDGPCEGYPVKPFTVPAGTLGTVTGIDDLGQIHVAWNCGSSLALIPGVDTFEIAGEERGSGFSIQRNILGKEVSLELTAGELDLAFKKARRDYLVQDILEKITELLEDEGLDISKPDLEASKNASPYAKALFKLYSSPEVLADKVEDKLSNSDSYWEDFWLSLEDTIWATAKELSGSQHP